MTLVFCKALCNRKRDDICRALHHLLYFQFFFYISCLSVLWFMSVYRATAWSCWEVSGGGATHLPSCWDAKRTHSLTREFEVAELCVNRPMDSSIWPTVDDWQRSLGAQMVHCWRRTHGANRTPAATCQTWHLSISSLSCAAINWRS